MNAFSFAPASRETARARIGLQGPAGSGKTKTALRLAEGLAKGGTIGLVDTERGSALKYAPVKDRPDLGGHEFGHMPMDTHDPRHLVQAVRIAEDKGVAVLIVDSWSHFWNGRGGLLEIVDQAGSQRGSGGSFGAWKVANPIEQEMLDALLNFRGHLIVTMRTKGDYVIEGKNVTKVGVRAVQREGAEYELDVVMDMVEGTGRVTKTRYAPLEGMTVHHPGEDVAETILDQLGQGVDPVAAIVDAVMAEDLTYDAALAQHANAARRNLLAAPVMHPVTSEPTTLQELIAERGKAVKPAPQQSGQSATSQQQAGQGTDTAAGGEGRAAVTAPQSRAMHAKFNELGFTEREPRLRATSLIVGRHVPTANDLTRDEANGLLDVLNSHEDQDSFVKLLDQLAAEANAA